MKINSPALNGGFIAGKHKNPFNRRIRIDDLKF